MTNNRHRSKQSESGMRWGDLIEWLVATLTGNEPVLASSSVGVGREGSAVKGRIWQGVRNRLLERARVSPYAGGNGSHLGNVEVELGDKTVATKTGSSRETIKVSRDAEPDAS